jgi:hypothetical protein
VLFVKGMHFSLKTQLLNLRLNLTIVQNTFNAILYIAHILALTF